jgi:energy-coupling factor transporter ATP-binding protein EcfA2
LYYRENQEDIQENILNFGNSLILLEDVDNLIFAFGKFEKDDKPIRITIASGAEKKLKNSIMPLIRDILKNHITDYILEEQEPSENPPDFISDKYIKDKHLTVSRIYGFIPPNISSKESYIFWTSKFFDRLSEFPENSYIVVVLRPFQIKDKDNENRIFSMIKFYNNIFTKVVSEKVNKYEKESGYKSENELDYESETPLGNNQYWKEGRKKESENKELTEKGTAGVTDISISPLQENIRLQYDRLMDFLYNALSSGLWWCSIYAIAPNDAYVRRLTSLYWSFISKIANNWSDNFSIYGRCPVVRENIDTFPQLTEKRLIKTESDLVNFYKRLRKFDVDLLFYRKDLKEDIGSKDYIIKSITDDGIDKCILGIVEGEPYEIPLTGNRLASIFQFPIDTNSIVNVEKGFNYCYKISHFNKEKANEYIIIGKCITPCSREDDFSESKESNSENSKAEINLSQLDKHLLIVGSTGSGKTNSVVSIIRAIKNKDSDIRVVILEGAKREYRGYLTGDSNFRIYDLQNSFIHLNIFEHPDFISYESHLSNLMGLFEGTLELPAPTPAILLDALFTAYKKYKEDIENNREIHNPILFYLLRYAILKSKEAGYAGEIASNIKSVIRTRIKSLSIGIAGRILSSSAKWKDIYENLMRNDIVIEFESIGDEKTRSFIMSLFALYYRYAVEEKYREIKNKHNTDSRDSIHSILVLEEAHRIIGRSGISINPNASQSSVRHLEMFSNMLSEIRAFKCGIIISDQSPSKLIPDAMKNTNTKLIMKLVSNDDIMSVIESSGLPEDAKYDIPKLKTGQAIYLSIENKPALIKVYKQEKPKQISDFQIDKGKEYERMYTDELNDRVFEIFSWDNITYDKLIKEFSSYVKDKVKDKKDDLIKKFKEFLLNYIKKEKKVNLSEEELVQIVEYIADKDKVKNEIKRRNEDKINKLPEQLTYDEVERFINENLTNDKQILEKIQFGMKNNLISKERLLKESKPYLEKDREIERRITELFNEEDLNMLIISFFYKERL